MKFKRLTAGLAAVAVALGGVMLAATPAAAATGYTFTVPAGTVMSNGDSIRSSKGQFQFVMQADGNAVVYGTGAQVLWQSGTSGNPGAQLAPQTDGNVVIYGARGAIWQSLSSGKGGTQLTLGDDGNLAMLNGSAPVWAAFSHQSSLYPGTILQPGEMLRSDYASNYQLVMQSDGNLVEYQGSRVVWQSQTNGNPGAALAYQTDGNMVIIYQNRPIWQAGTSGQSAGRIYLDNGGTFRVHNASGTAVWESATTGGGWVRPSGGNITSGFGPRTAPVPGASTYHNGVDLGASCNASIVAASGGSVELAEPNGSYGNYIRINHGGGITTAYAHIANGGLRVTKGQTVTAGQLIGLVGNTGISGGCHLHFETRIGGEAKDPVPFMAARGVTIR